MKKKETRLSRRQFIQAVGALGAAAAAGPLIATGAKAAKKRSGSKIPKVTPIQSSILMALLQKTKRQQG